MIASPLATMLIYWLVFSVGLKVRPAEGVSFLLFLICGMIPWLTFNEALMTSVNSITGAPHLVKKIAFPTILLPFMHLLVSLIPHFTMLVVLQIILFLKAMPFSWNFLLVFYYMGALYFLCMGISWFVASIGVFSRDVSQGLTIVLGFGFWLTPIVWPPSMLGDYVGWLIFNPLNYIVDGYRDAFLNTGSFWDNGFKHLVFWAICIPIFLIGEWVFRKLQRDFVEVL